MARRVGRPRHVVAALRRLLTAAAVALCLCGAVAAQEGPAPADLLDVLLSTFLDFPARDAAQLQAEVEEIGGLRFRRPVALDLLPSEVIRPRLTELFDAEFPREALAHDALVLEAFGLLPPGYDLRQARLQLLLDNVVGFYDDRPGRQRLYVVAAEPRLTPSAQMIAVHELRHALQDQHAPTHHALSASIGGFDDRRLAYMSLIEGDAIVVMEQFLRRRQREGGSERDLSGVLPATEVPGVPAVLSAQLLAPYTAGRPFVQALQQARGWDGVGSAWAHPPRSTEQVLHPQAFLRGEEPLPLPVLRWVPPGSLVADGVLGELLVRVLLGDAPDSAAAGWGGDEYRLWQAHDGVVLLWRSRWDTDDDRREFAEAARGSFARRYRAGVPGAGCDVYDGDGRSWAWCSTASEERLLSAPTASLRRWLAELAQQR